MKKMNLTKLMAVLVVLCLITSTFVGSTLAKYVTGAKADDTARVAKFGVDVTATADAFATEYAATGSYTDKNGTAIANTVVSSETDKNVIAPGTNGALGATKIEGTPEVAVNVTKVATLTLEGWDIDTDDDGTEDAFYCPIIIKVNSTTFDGKTYNNATDFINAVEAAIETNVNYAPNTTLDGTDNVAITWEWPFEISDEYDVKDTALGDKAADGNEIKIALALETTVTQLD